MNKLNFIMVCSATGLKREVSTRRTCGMVRTLLVMVGLTLCACVPALAHPPSPHSVQPPNPGRQIPANPLPASVPNGFTVAAVGDLIVSKPIPLGNANFDKVVKLLQGADVTFGNLEDTLINPRKQKIWPAPLSGGAVLSGTPAVAQFLKKIGFDMVSRSNNHSTDWGVRGMEATDKLLDDVGMVHAGTGSNLGAARAPAYLTAKHAEVALVSMASSFTGMEPAGPAEHGLVGRPGASVLRTTRYVLVTPAQMRDLVNIYNGQAHKPKKPASADTKNLKLFGVHYRVSQHQGVTRTMNQYDLDDILRNIRNGKENANFELAYIHAHEPGNWSATSPTFLRKLAHDAIDAGADEFVASGPHRLHGIEIYKGKPIFYSLGNFFFAVAQQRFVAPEQILKFGLDPATTTAHEHYQRLLKNFHFTSPLWYESVVAISTFNSNGKVRKITLYPVYLGHQRTPAVERGIPYRASHEVAQRILHLMQRLSRPLGTHIEIHGDKGVILVGNN